MDHLTTQSVDQGLSLPNEDERGIKESPNVQMFHVEAEGQLDWPQIESPTARHDVR